MNGRVTTAGRSRRPTVVYYSVAGYLDHLPSQVRVLSQSADVHVVIEVSPGAWRRNLLDLPHPGLPAGFHDGRAFLGETLPPAVFDDFAGAAGVHLSVYPRKADVSGQLRAILATRRGVNGIRPDVIHLDGESPRVATWIGSTACPLVVSVHEPVSTAFQAHAGVYGLGKRTVISRASHVIVHSHEACRELVSGARGRLPNVTVAELGPTDAFARWPRQPPAASDAAGATVAFVGTLSARKGFDLFLGAAHHVARRCRGVRFVIGGIPLSGVGEPRSGDLPNGGRLDVIARQLSVAEIAGIMDAATILVAPYREARQSGVVLTAYAFGVPVVASDIPAMREQIEDGVSGVIVPRTSVVTLADAVAGLLESPERLSRLRDGVAQVADHRLAWSRFAETVSRVYDEVSTLGSGDPARPGP